MNFSGNQTPSVPANVAVWRPLAVISLLITVSALIFNGALLMIFFKEKKLRTSFNVYLINLLLANFTYFIFAGPFDLIQNLYSVWWVGRSRCTLFMYAWMVITLVQMTTHPLIALNRICALWTPVFYWRAHSYMSAILMCAGSWALAHVIALPGLIMDHFYYRLPEEENGCVLNTAVPRQAHWYLVVQFMSTGAELIMLISFPLIWLKERSRKKVGSSHDLRKPRASPVGTIHGTATMGMVMCRRTVASARFRSWRGRIKRLNPAVLDAHTYLIYT